jgi:hypothetical protein
MAVDSDKFVIASLALWAGDFANFEQQLLEYSNPRDVKHIYRSAETPEDFIKATGALRLRQFWQRRGEFKKIISEYSVRETRITETPNIFETKNLRATLWRTGEREFLMKGYLKELSWQDALFKRARDVARRAASTNVDTLRQAGEAFDSEAGERAFEGLGVAWIVPANPFIQIEVTDLGLLEATGLWTLPMLPENSDPITTPFVRVLQTLDPT